MIKKFQALLFLLLLTWLCDAQQITVPTIEQMPNRPSPYLMRNWKQVARGYDSLVFNFNLTGQYLPLVWLNTSTINYPAQNSFGLNTVVGTTVPSSAEAINCLPAIVSATLCSIDKSNQNGYNWVLMAEEWFNKRPEQNVYKNHPVDDTGDDWWYETMPNVFFYQLNYLYPGTGDYNNQFTTVADRWLQAVVAMGASGTPWQIPAMDHRGWYLQTMTPYDQSVHEPEAAGAIAWLLYNAYVKTGTARYRIGAEWAMEFLNQYATDPSYELQLSYGTYLAARMNAELGTQYDVEKMVNWCFDVGPLRSWGAMTGTWGAYDCSGLIGEVNGSNNYAFAMNTFEQAGALIPMTRYDARFARAIGKWALNAANAARLFYPNYLPANYQDSYAWAHQYDTNSYIAHEALRQFNGSTSPYGTGDAISGGWGATTLTLYGSSHVGILGGIIDTTDVPMILCLDLLKTDYYRSPADPSYLYYNPYDNGKTITVDAGSGMHDIYDAAAHQYIANGVSGATQISIPANSAVLAVIVPSGGTTTDNLDETLVNGIVIDYHSGRTIAYYPPRIKMLAADQSTLLRGDTANVYCTAVDRDTADTIAYTWRSSRGSISGSGSRIRWIAPNSIEIDTIFCIIRDLHGAQDSSSVIINVTATVIAPPIINRFIANPRKFNPGGTSRITCSAHDPNGDTLSFSWSAVVGSITGSDSIIQWTAPDSIGNYFVFCRVDDKHGGATLDSIELEVRDLSQHQTGTLTAYLPFNGNANDASGNGNNGTVHGATLALDHAGHINSAYAFNGTTSYIEIANTQSLNFQTGITVSFWMYIGALYTREQYPISHGNWQNRWKVSISNDRLRWTVKTATGVKDLDSQTLMNIYQWYFVVATYDGSDMELWLNGYLDSFEPWSGLILTTAIDPVIGQDLPTDQNYNFNGSLDEVRIYNYALSVPEIDTLSGILAVGTDRSTLIPTEYFLRQNYPNPFNPSTRIEYGLPQRTRVTLTIFDVLGKKIATLVDRTQEPGYQSIVWNTSGLPSGVYYYRLSTPSFQSVKKLVLLK